MKVNGVLASVPHLLCCSMKVVMAELSVLLPFIVGADADAGYDRGRGVVMNAAMKTQWKCDS